MSPGRTIARTFHQGYQCKMPRIVRKGQVESTMEGTKQEEPPLEATLDSKIKETLTDLEETRETFKTQEVTESPTGEMEPHNKHPGPMVEASMGDKQASRQSIKG